MNSWKEAPHLFTNGKFKAKVNNEWGIKGRIIGFEKDRHFNGFTIEHTVMSAPNTFTCESCTLIARPISDMSDGEIRIYSDNWIGYENEGRSAFIDLSADVMMPTRLLLYLISIGVYPLNQNHNDIIWRYENTNR